MALGFAEHELESLTLYRARAEGNSSGYKGRIGIFQVMPVTPALAELIAADATDAELNQHLIEHGITDLRRSALNKVKAGITDIDEVERVLGLLEHTAPISRPTPQVNLPSALEETA